VCAYDDKEAGREGGIITPTPGKRPPATTKFSLENLEASTALIRFTNTAPTTQVPLKTFGPDHAELRYNDGDETIGRLEQIRVALIRLTNPNTGFVSVQMSLEYLATSNGSRTPDGRTLPGATTAYTPGREPYKLKHWVYFRNAAGGLVYTWWVGQDFQLNCGWNRQYCQHGTTETNILGWFDAVRGYNWQISGLFYPC